MPYFLASSFTPANRGFLAAHQIATDFIFEEFVQIFASVGAAGRSANNFDHFVDVVERDAVAEQNVLALLGLAQVVLRAAAHHVNAVIDEQAQQFEQAQFARLAGDDGQHDHAERFLHLGHA